MLFKNKKTLFIIVINLIILLLFVVLLDVITYKLISIQYQNYYDFQSKYEHNIKEPFITNCSAFSCFKCDNTGRKPDGLQYTNPPITVFGCSFAYGMYLEPNQTFSYRLSEALKCPVYNRALPGEGIQIMYYQANSTANENSLKNFFYKIVPPSDTVIYILIDDHYRRMLVDYFDELTPEINLRYIKKNNKLHLINKNTPLKKFFKSLYFIKFANQKYIQNNINNPKNAEKLTDLMLLHFIETRNELQKKWNKEKINFNVIFYSYEKIPHKNLLRNKLEKNDFKVIDTDDLIDIDLSSTEYNDHEKDHHPNAKAWKILTPLIIEKLEF